MRNLRWLTVLAALMLVLAACGNQTASPSEEPSAQESQPAASANPNFEAMVYPEDGPAECAAPADDEHDAYTGLISEIRAVDELTVEFTLCAPLVPFLDVIAFASFGINDTAWLEEHVPDGTITEQMNGTGPYKFVEWARGDHITYEANADYWGDAPIAPNGILRWSPEAAQRLLELESGTIDGIDNVGTADFETAQANPDLQVIPRESMNTFYIGFNNTFDPWSDVRVRQAIAMGIDRQRIVDNFLPPNSEVATHFTPCTIDFGCGGDEWFEFDPEGARDLLAEAGFPDGFDTTLSYRNVVRGYLPEPPIVAQDIQAQLAENLGINVTLNEVESGAFSGAVTAGQCCEPEVGGIFLYGWGADYPDASNFLDFHFGPGAGPKFGDIYQDVAEQLTIGSTSLDDADREAAYTAANDAIKENVPVAIMTHAGSATAWLADVEGAHASPLGNEKLAALTPGDRDQVVFMQNAEPISLYCADESDGESLRACEQTMESLYQYETGGFEAEPALAEECTPNDEATVWTCTLRSGVTFHDGATFDANDVVLSYAVQWDAEHPLHVGNTSAFEYFQGLWGGFLNAPLPEPE
jgi:peptide/nickel transport system substrate-binding protein